MSGFTFSDKKVLIVEDQRPFLVLLRGLLNGLGASSVKTAQHAEQAVVLCKQNQFDMVIADLHYGSDRKNGFELIEEIRTKKWLKPNAIFLLISADTARPIVMGSIERRPDDFLVKPFSQAQIKSRLIRAWLKRQFLAPVYFAVSKDQTSQAIETAQSLLSQPSQYKRHCLQLLIELYWKNNQPEKAMQLLKNDESGQQSLWSQIAMGKTLIALKQYDDAGTLAEQLIKKNKFCVEAYDVLAESLSAKQEAELALDTIKQALKISPFSLQRQYVACRIAREHGDYPLASDTCFSIWELSKRSVHQSASHWCSYIRSLLDAAQFAEDKRGKNRFQQEALLAMQRSKFDESLGRLTDEFDFSIFEELVHARINAIDGKLIEAKRNLAQSQFIIDKSYETFPAVYAPDSVYTLFQIGEFEQGQQLINRLSSEQTKLDPNSQYAVDHATKDVSDVHQAYQSLNQKGISLYQEGKFSEAKETFQQAQKLAPVNTGVALNLLQCLLKMMNNKTSNKVDAKLVAECRSVYKLIDGMPMVGQHLEKYDSLSEELKAILD
ncbi:response regulator [Alteromonas sediminis]|uniref:Response regulator n=1 Tax=Alteromonas sediminis TaxID=2259342 RepID=A0A3N5Y3T0_9ALTE|nr:response regulator [Alteromonas sediminis]RPJ67526.1 response regulator [Alteromonas sediminis]